MEDEQKFKPGDIVKRVRDYYNGMKIGDTDTVIEFVQNGWILEKFGDGHSTDSLELVESSTQFKVGDKVKRTGSDSFGIKEGEIYTVSSMGEEKYGVFWMGVEEVIRGNGKHPWDSSLFELVKVRPHINKEYFKNTKIRVSSPEESERVQKRLFELGFEWSRDRAKEAQYTGAKYLFIGNNITYEDSDASWFMGNKNKEITVGELLGTEMDSTVGTYKGEFPMEFKSMEVETMEKPETQLEKNALAKAKEDVIEKAIENKALDYEASMNTFISTERRARQYRREADELAKKLGITSQEMKNLF